jgi:serine/threonine-protein kinase RsbW
VINQPPSILVISSHKSELQRVEKFVKDVFAYFEIPLKYYNKVLLTISEATINSIVHGNKSDLQKKVELDVDCKNHLISVRITDEGEGFNYETLPDPTKQENILKESGRGIHIIKSVAKSVSFNKKGNSVQFEIQCK